MDYTASNTVLNSKLYLNTVGGSGAVGAGGADRLSLTRQLDPSACMYRGQSCSADSRSPSHRKLILQSESEDERGLDGLQLTSTMSEVTSPHVSQSTTCPQIVDTVIQNGGALSQVREQMDESGRGLLHGQTDGHGDGLLHGQTDGLLHGHVNKYAGDVPRVHGQLKEGTSGGAIIHGQVTEFADDGSVGVDTDGWV